MSISGVNGVGANQYAYRNNNQKVTNTGSFVDEVKRAEKNQNTARTDASVWEGDMVIPQPPSYNGFQYDISISNKSKEEMTMEEYKQWFMNEMSQMPVSSWVRSTFSSGALVIKEEAFERMKSDPEYEKYVSNRIRSMYSVSSLPVGPNHVGYEVIGASPEECYGYAGPVGNGSSNIFNNEESWWEKRYKKMVEYLETQENYLKSQLVSQQILQSFFMEKTQSGQGIRNIDSS